MDPVEQFKEECLNEIKAQGENKEFRALTSEWIEKANQIKYSYHFSWLSRPVIQYPQDIVQVQELIWEVKPDLIIETGIAHGGSLILSASILAMLDYCEAVESGATLDPSKSKRKVLGLDIDIRDHNKREIESHPMSKNIQMIQGSSTSKEVVEEVEAIAQNYNKILVFLDSNHTHEHVLNELKAYAPLVSKDSYCVVFDTIVEDLKESKWPGRSWCKGDNPKTAVREYLKENTDFVVDKLIDAKLQISVAPEGFLKRVK